MRLQSASLFVVLVGGSAAAVQAAPLLQYNFNEPGTQAFATGTASTNGQPVLNIQGTGAARGAAGSGVSGAPSDLALDNTNSNGIFGGGGAFAAGDFKPIDGLQAFTLTGWYRLPSTAQAIGAQASLIEDINFQASSGNPGGFSLTGGARSASGALRLRVNEVGGIETAPGTYSEVGQYVNFAVTYDGTTANFYKGLVNQPIALVESDTYAQGAVVDNTQPLIVGISQGGSSLTFSPFNGLIDNVGIYGSVLSQGQLETLRQSAVPEPTSMAGIALGGLALLRRRRRRA